MTTNFSFLIVWTLTSWAIGYLAGRMLARVRRSKMTEKEWLERQTLAYSRLHALNLRLQRDNARLEQELRKIER